MLCDFSFALSHKVVCTFLLHCGGLDSLVVFSLLLNVRFLKRESEGYD